MDIVERTQSVSLSAVVPGAAGQPAEDESAAVVRELAFDITKEARASLMMAFRFMDVALWRLPLDEGPIVCPFGTDGAKLYVNALATIARFEEEFDEVIRDYLHSVLHCVFRQPFDTDHTNLTAWSLACDMVVESVALDMCGERFSSEQDAERRKEVRQLEQLLGSLNPLKLYRFFAGEELDAREMIHRGYTTAKIWDLGVLFTRDSHDAWANQRKKREEGENESQEDGIRKRNLSDRLQDLAEDQIEEPEERNDQEPPQQEEPNDAQSLNAEDQEDQGSLSQDAQAAQETEDGQEGGESDESLMEAMARLANEKLAEEDSLEDWSQDQEALEQEWEEIAKQMEEDLETFSQNHSGGAGSLMQNLAIANRKQVNYAEFLRQFSALGEDMKINDDEFDYIFYTYGLDVYGNMPLVEPLEYQERNRIREFVIALDTSGSCKGELVKRFVTRTYEILSECEEFGDTVNIHIIQCDCRVQTDLKITRPQDLEEYCRNFQAYGFGGTDFTPVFDYVDSLIEEGEFENLRGLIYFTDGYGTFPQRMPSYDTAFVFVEDGSGARSVPPWAMRVLLDEDEIRRL